MGDMQRQYAKEKGITIEELGELEAKDDSIDKEIDSYQTKLSEKEDNFVIDGWLSFHFVKGAIRIFLNCDIEVGAKRIHGDTSSNKRDSSEKKTQSVEDAKKIILEREKVNRKRWKEYYDVDYLDMSNYDIVLDTSNLTIKETANQIEKEIREKFL